MPARIECLHMNHINIVVGAYDDVDHFADTYGAQFLLDLPKPEWHACLIGIGGVIFELFSPNDDILHARFGPHYLGVEYQIPDVSLARRAVQERGIRIIRELDTAFHMHPADVFGVSLEVYDQSFHTDPPPVKTMQAIRPVEHWRDDHPLGLTGLKRIGVGVSDADAAVAFFTDLTDGTVIYEEARPAVDARAVGLQLADTVIELLTPVEGGAGAGGELAAHLARWGDGIRSTVFEVNDLGKVEAYFAGRGVQPRPGDAPGTLALDPADNAGVLFEFSE